MTVKEIIDLFCQGAIFAVNVLLLWVQKKDQE